VFSSKPIFEIVALTLLHVDDLVRISATQSGLQKLMARLEGFCEDRGLTVNTETTATLVLGARKCLKVPITLKGMPVEQVESLKFLGIPIPPDV
jgi:hypothetical protein